MYQMIIVFFFFFFQAEDGIRDLTVTGVQTCALPISCRSIVYLLCFSFLTVELADEKQLQTPPDVCRELRNAAWQERRDALVVSPQGHPLRRDRKSTRLNSSHSQISYAVFCLKNKQIMTRVSEVYAC